MSGQLSHLRNTYGTVSVVDPDPGSGAFLTPGSGMGKKSRSGSGMNIHYNSETFFWLKILTFLMRIWNLFDPGSGREKNSDPG